MILNTIAIFAIIPYRITLMGDQSVSGDSPTSLIVMINLIFQVLYMFVLIRVGIRLQNRTGLNTPILNGIVYPKAQLHISKKWLINSIVGTFIGSVMIILLDLFVFSPLIGAPMDQLPSPIHTGICAKWTLRFVVWVLVLEEGLRICNDCTYVSRYLSSCSIFVITLLSKQALFLNMESVFFYE